MNEASGGSNQHPSFWFGPRKVSYAPQPVHGLVDKSLARKAVKDALYCFRVDKAQDVDLYEEVEANLMMAMSCSNLTSIWEYIMVTWGCEPAVAKGLLDGVSVENKCTKACSWLLEVAYPLRPSNRQHYACPEALVEHESRRHEEWQERRVRLAIKYQHATRMALQPPTWPSQAISWRKLALWRAKKLGLPGVRHNHGLLLGSVRDAAAKITMMEFGLDPEKGGHNSSLLMQLLSLEDNQWQHLMEKSARIDMATDGLLNMQPSEIPWFPRYRFEHQLAYYRATRGPNSAETIMCQKYGNVFFMRPGEYENIVMRVLWLDGQPVCLNNEQPYEHRNHNG